MADVLQTYKLQLKSEGSPIEVFLSDSSSASPSPVRGRSMKPPPQYHEPDSTVSISQLHEFGRSNGAINNH